MATNPDTLFQEASCFRCASNASLSDLLTLALLDRIATAGGGGGGTPGGADTQVQFNDAGAFGGDADFTWNKTTNLLSITGGETIIAEANEVPFTISGYSLTGANAQSLLSLAGTWNTTGNPVGIRMAITNTASGATSKLLEFLVGAAGATSAFNIDKAGTITLGTTNTANIASQDHGGVAGIRIRQGSAAGTDGIGSATSFWAIGNAGFQVRNSATTELYFFAAPARLGLVSNYDIAWAASTTDSSSAKDAGIGRTSAGLLQINNGTPGTFRDLTVRTIFSNNAASLVSTNTTLTDFAAAGAGTITNAPTAGNPAKWIAIVDNGTTRYIPTWI